MIKTLVSLTSHQMEILGKEAESLEISKSELLRRIMDRYLSSRKITKKDLNDKAEKKQD
jgi:hypothetical protein